MKLKRHKTFIKDFKKVQITDGQFEKFIQFINCLREDSPLPEESKDHALNGEYSDCREFHLGVGTLFYCQLLPLYSLLFLYNDKGLKIIHQVRLLTRHRWQ